MYLHPSIDLIPSQPTDPTSFEPIDALLTSIHYTNLVGHQTRRTASEERYADEQRFAHTLRQHTQLGDPLLSTEIDLRQLLFSHQQELTEEEEGLPSSILHQSSTTIKHMYALKSWHRVLHKDLDPQKLRPFLGFRPSEIVRKTLQNTTQLARMIIRLPLRKHIKPRFPFLNGRRINEGISSDRLYANCPDLAHGFTAAHVFYGMQSTNIQVYGHHLGGDGFYNSYKDFCREHGIPSVLRRDNAKENKSNKVRDFNRENLVRDEFSEVDNQQQNVVESGGIRWLKAATHILLDQTGAPAWAWFLAAVFLADVHNHTWNKERNCIPATARDGITRDISRLLQFVFWERVLYLDHEDSFPESKERPGYFVGCSKNIGDELTYMIYDDQTKQLVHRSVVRPYHSNKRVRWDPIFDPKTSLIFKQTATDKQCLFPTDLSDTHLDQYDLDDPEPTEHFWDTTHLHPDPFFEPEESRIKKYESILRNPDLCLSPPPIAQMIQVEPAIPDSYTGESALRFSAQPITVHPQLKKRPKKKKKIPSSQAHYDTEFSPPTMDDTDTNTEKVRTTLVGDRIAKQFTDGIFLGTITETWQNATSLKQYFRILYDDNDCEDLSLAEVVSGIQLIIHHPEEERYPPSSPSSPSPTTSELSDTPSPIIRSPPMFPFEDITRLVYTPEQNDTSTETNSTARGDTTKASLSQSSLTISHNRGEIFHDSLQPSPKTHPNQHPSIPTSTDRGVSFQDSTTNSNSPETKPIQQPSNRRRTRSEARSTMQKLGIILFTSSACLQNPSPIDTPSLTPSPHPASVSFPPLNQNLLQHDSAEALRAYHSYLDKINDMFSPDPDHDLWKPQNILSHKIRHDPTTSTHRIYLKIQWPDIDTPRQLLKLDTLRIEQPWMCVKYAFQRGLVHKPGWEWIPEYIESDKMLSTLVHSYRTSVLKGKKFEFGVEIPKTTRAATVLDTENNDTLWDEATKKELFQIIHEFSSFEPIDNDMPTPHGYKRVPYHIIYACKVDGRRKARLVIDGNRSPPVDKEDCFSPVVSVEAIRLGFFMAEMHGLECVAGDVGNAYLTSYTTEKLYIIAGKEFGPELEGKRLKVVKSVYGTKSAAARFHESLSAKLRHINFRPSRADPDLWFRANPEGGYEYIARYVDDVMCFSKDPQSLMDYLRKSYTMKGVGYPQFYLGGDVTELPEPWRNHNVSYGLSAHTYIANCTINLERMCNTIFHKVSVPFDPNYHAELDTTSMCSPTDMTKYRSLLGSANWLITLGRFDIHYAVNTLAQYCVAPRQGHLQALQRVFGYLKKHPNGMMLIDTSEPPGRTQATFHKDCDWSEYFPDAIEELPRRPPPPFGEPVTLTAYVDADHARNALTRRSVTGIILLINNTPIVWISKRQRTVETSTFGSEMIAARIAIDLLVEMRYKLRCLGIPVERRSILLGDNLSVVVNTTLPSSQIKKKHLSCSIMRIREAVAAGFVRFGHIRSEQNIADIATKPLGPQVFHRVAHDYLFRHLQYHSDTTPPLPSPSPFRHYNQNKIKKNPHSDTNPNLVPD
jgi:hypothetical protein